MSVVWQRPGRERNGREPDVEPVSHREQAEQLRGLLRECQTAGIARRACVVHLSKLGGDRVRPHHLRLARAALEPLAHADRARLFTLPGQDLVAIWRGPAATALRTSRAAILHLFSDDGSGGDAGDLVAAELIWEELDLPEQAERLLAIAKGTLAPSELQAPAVATAPLDPTSLRALEQRLAQADVARFARRKRVCVAGADGSLQLSWERRFLCIDEITESLSPDHAPHADPWLFRRLTRTLDRRMLALLAAPGELDDAGAFAINLNVSSILGPEFLRFDAALPSHLRGLVTLDLQPEDILSDPAAFLFARDFARARGYRLLLHGVTADLLPVFPLSRLGLDLLHLRWSGPLLGSTEAIDGPRTVLGGVDSREALDWGLARGIRLFQGGIVAEQPRHIGFGRA